MGGINRQRLESDINILAIGVLALGVAIILLSKKVLSLNLVVTNITTNWGRVGLHIVSDVPLTAGCKNKPLAGALH